MQSHKEKKTRIWLPIALFACFSLAAMLGFIVFGSPENEVPDLLGLNVEDARSKAESRGFMLVIESMQSAGYPEDTVISQDPEPGTKAGDHKEIAVIISRNDQDGFVVMPNVLGMTEEEARAQLGQLEIQVSISYKQSVSYKAGAVIDQDPRGGDEIRVGSSVALTVAEERPTSSGGCIVCLDPGHADTPSHIDEETGLNTMDWASEPEIQIVYDIALRARDLLEARGVRVIMTKQSIYDPVDLKQRAVIANQAGANLILHIHTDPGISAPSTFYPGGGESGWKGNTESGRKVYIDPQVQRESERLAKVFHAAMASYMQVRYGVSGGGVIVENRGATGTGNYGPILSYDIWSKVPTFTIENNQSFADAHRQEIAEGIVEGIVACLGDPR